MEARNPRSRIPFQSASGSGQAPLRVSLGTLGMLDPPPLNEVRQVLRAEAHEVTHTDVGQAGPHQAFQRSQRDAQVFGGLSLGFQIRFFIHVRILGLPTVRISNPKCADELRICGKTLQAEASWRRVMEGGVC